MLGSTERDLPLNRSPLHSHHRHQRRPKQRCSGPSEYTDAVEVMFACLSGGNSSRFSVLGEFSVVSNEGNRKNHDVVRNNFPNRADVALDTWLRKADGMSGEDRPSCRVVRGAAA